MLNNISMSKKISSSLSEDDEVNASESKEGISPVGRYIRWLKPFKWRVAIIIVFGLVGVLFSVLQPLVMRFLVDSIVLSDDWLQGEKLTLSICVALVALVFSAGSSIFSLCGIFERVDLSGRIVSFVREKAFSNLLKLPLSELELIKSSGASNRLINDTDEISDLLGEAVTIPIVYGTRVFITLVLLFWVNWRIALFALLLVLPALGLSYVAVRRIKPLYSAMFASRGELVDRMTELFRGIRVLRIYNREEREKLHFAQASHFIVRIKLAAMKLERAMNAGWTMIISLASLIIISVGCVLSLKGYATFGDIFALSIYTSFILVPISTLVNARTKSKKGLAALERVCEVLEPAYEDSLLASGRHLPGCINSIEFQSVTFSYVPDVPILRDISFSAKRGETVALVGRSGAGKSTLIDLLSRFYNPDRGLILLNGVDISEFSIAAYRRQIAIVEQELTLFDGSIGQNIAYAKPSASHGEVEESARKAGAHEFIISQRNGYDTLVGERGCMLSGGQKQRVSIARAFLADPKILILDEATCSLDAETESSVQNSLRSLVKERVTFIIAHRLSTIQSADKIIVLHEGKIVEIGSHSELIEMKGRYFTSVMNQMGIDEMPVELV